MSILGKKSISDSAMSLICSNCACEFESRNKLFSHLKFCSLKLDETQFSADFLEHNDPFIYATGGRLRGRTLGSVERYSIKLQNWEKCQSMQENRGSHCSSSFGTVLTVIGGGGFKHNLSSVENYDSIKMEWSLGAPMPTPRHALAVTSIDNFVYAVGGWFNGSVCSSELERYDVVENKWESLAPMNVGRRMLGAAAHKDKLYVFGGNNADGDWNSDDLEIYDTLTNTWTSGPKLPEAGATSAVTVGDFIYVFLHGKYLVRYCPATSSYARLGKELPLKQWFSFDVAAINGTIYVVGGNCEGKWANVLYQYTIHNNTWTQLPSMDHQRRRCAASIINYAKPN